MTRAQAHSIKVQVGQTNRLWKHYRFHEDRRKWKKQCSRWYGIPFRSYRKAKAFDSRRCGFELPF